MGQCNDAYGAIAVAVALAKAFDCGVNDLPLTLVISWFEQKAVAVLLTLLARRAGEVLSRTLIAEMVWDMNFDSDTNVVDVNVRRLRSKVDDPFPVKLIHTVRGAGYVLDAEQ